MENTALQYTLVEDEFHAGHLGYFAKDTQENVELVFRPEDPMKPSHAFVFSKLATCVEVANAILRSEFFSSENGWSTRPIDVSSTIAFRHAIGSFFTPQTPIFTALKLGHSVILHREVFVITDDGFHVWVHNETLGLAVKRQYRRTVSANILQLKKLMLQDAELTLEGSVLSPFISGTTAESDSGPSTAGADDVGFDFKYKPDCFIINNRNMQRMSHIHRFYSLSEQEAEEESMKLLSGDDWSGLESYAELNTCVPNDLDMPTFVAELEQQWSNNDIYVVSSRHLFHGDRRSETYNALFSRVPLEIAVLIASFITPVKTATMTEMRQLILLGHVDNYHYNLMTRTSSFQSVWRQLYDKYFDSDCIPCPFPLDMRKSLIRWFGLENSDMYSKRLDDFSVADILKRVPEQAWCPPLLGNPTNVRIRNYGYELSKNGCLRDELNLLACKAFECKTSTCSDINNKYPVPLSRIRFNDRVIVYGASSDKAFCVARPVVMKLLQLSITMNGKVYDGYATVTASVASSSTPAGVPCDRILIDDNIDLSALSKLIDEKVEYSVSEVRNIFKFENSAKFGPLVLAQSNAKTITPLEHLHYSIGKLCNWNLSSHELLRRLAKTHGVPRKVWEDFIVRPRKSPSLISNFWKDVYGHSIYAIHIFAISFDFYELTSHRKNLSSNGILIDDRGGLVVTFATTVHSLLVLVNDGYSFGSEFHKSESRLRCLESFFYANHIYNVHDLLAGCNKDKLMECVSKSFTMLDDTEKHHLRKETMILIPQLFSLLLRSFGYMSSLENDLGYEDPRCRALLQCAGLNPHTYLLNGCHGEEKSLTICVGGGKSTNFSEESNIKKFSHNSTLPMWYLHQIVASIIPGTRILFSKPRRDTWTLATDLNKPVFHYEDVSDSVICIDSLWEQNVGVTEDLKADLSTSHQIAVLPLLPFMERSKAKLPKSCIFACDASRSVGFLLHQLNKMMGLYNCICDLVRISGFGVVTTDINERIDQAGIFKDGVFMRISSTDQHWLIPFKPTSLFPCNLVTPIIEASVNDIELLPLVSVVKSSCLMPALTFMTKKIPRCIGYELERDFDAMKSKSQPLPAAIDFRFVEILLQNVRCGISTSSCISASAFQDIIRLCSQMATAENLIVDVGTPENGCVVVVGDLYGSLDDLIHILTVQGLPCSNQKYLFTGDLYSPCDINSRGPQKGSCIDIIQIVLCLKLAYPDFVTILCGNRDHPMFMTGDGFHWQLKKPYPTDYRILMGMLICFFCRLPLGAVIGGTVFASNGSIPRCEQKPTEYYKEYCEAKKKAQSTPEGIADNLDGGGCGVDFYPDLSIVSLNTLDRFKRISMFAPHLLGIMMYKSPYALEPNTPAHRMCYIENSINCPELSAEEFDEIVGRDLVPLLFATASVNSTDDSLDSKNIPQLTAVVEGLLDDHANDFDGSGDCYNHSYPWNMRAFIASNPTIEIILCSYHCGAEGFDLFHAGRTIQIVSSASFQDQSLGVYAVITDSVTNSTQSTVSSKVSNGLHIQLIQYGKEDD